VTGDRSHPHGRCAGREECESLLIGALSALEGRLLGEAGPHRTHGSNRRMLKTLRWAWGATRDRPKHPERAHGRGARRGRCHLAIAMREARVSGLHQYAGQRRDRHARWVPGHVREPHNPCHTYLDLTRSPGPGAYGVGGGSRFFSRSSNSLRTFFRVLGASIGAFLTTPSRWSSRILKPRSASSCEL
jgi:hypothetical protein